MFWIYIGIIFVASFLWAIISTRRELSKPEGIAHIKKKLAKEKILFKR